MSLPTLQQFQAPMFRPADAKLRAMEFHDKSRRTDIAEDRNAIFREGQALNREQFEENKQKAALKEGLRFLPSAQWTEYKEIKKWLGGFGLPVDLLPDNVTEKSFPEVLQKIVMGVDGASQLGVAKINEQVAQENRIALEKEKQRGRMVLKDAEPKDGKNLTKMQLTEAALNGDLKAVRILEEMINQSRQTGEASAQGKISGLLKSIDVDELAQTIIDGRETIENIPNPFGVPLRAIVRDKVLEIDSEYNFILPRATVRAIDTSLKTQEKQRGLMGSFVRNINKQVSRVDEIAQEVDRWGVRALDLPKRELITRLKGSGKEKVLEAYLTEISAEIGKLSTGSSASIRELSTEAQERWNKIHDPNLSIGELKIILEETRDMAEMRISSTNEEIEFTKERLKNLKSGSSTTLHRSGPQTQQLPTKFEILSVED